LKGAQVPIDLAVLAGLLNWLVSANREHLPEYWPDIFCGDDLQLPPSVNYVDTLEHCSNCCPSLHLVVSRVGVCLAGGKWAMCLNGAGIGIGHGIEALARSPPFSSG
jgi:hypothetical protein